jgi:hypothetical protein
MANCYYHSLSSVKKWGGKPEDYQPIHDWFDESKKIVAHFTHRALRHHAEGCYAAEREFGTTITNSDGKKSSCQINCRTTYQRRFRVDP